MRCLWFIFLVVSGAVAQEPSLTKEAVSEQLRALTVGEGNAARTLDAISRLDSERFVERRKALAFLLAEPLLQRELLETAFDTASLDKQLMLHQILEMNREIDSEERLVRSLRSVIDGGHKGLASMLLDALEGKTASRLDTGVMARQSLLATLVETDGPLLSEASKSATVLVREAALAGLAALAKADGSEVFLSLAKDPDEEIRFLAANELAKRHLADCLPAFASLLASDVFAIRQQSHEALMAMTGKDFGFLAGANKAERTKPAGLWVRWVEQFIETVSIDYDAYVNYLDEEEFPLRDE